MAVSSVIANSSSMIFIPFLTLLFQKKNTALHYAAGSGLKRCVELLVSQAAPLFPENMVKQTPCDSAEANGHGEIARYLESKMVFSNEDDNTEDLDSLLDQMETESVEYCEC